MSLNVSKCNLLSITRSKKPVLFNYNVNGYVLQCVNEMGDLIGVFIDKTLSWNSFVNNIVAKYNKILWLIKPQCTLGYDASLKVKYHPYNLLVCSKLEYCTQVWGGPSNLIN